MPPVSQLAKGTPRFRFVWFLVLGLLAQRLEWLRTFRQWVHSRASRQPPQRNVAPVSEGSGKGAYRGRQARQTASARGQSSEHQSNALPGAIERALSSGLPSLINVKIKGVVSPRGQSAINRWKSNEISPI